MPVAKVDAKRPRGRMTAYAFFMQTCRKEQEKNHPEEKITFLEFAKMCAERWKIMPGMEKKRFHKMAEDDKKRYDEELKIYTYSIKEEKEKQGTKRKQDQDPNSPKRPMPAFFWFSKDERPKVMNQNPGFGGGDIARELGRRWADAKSAERNKYQAKAAEDMARYEEEITAYKKKNSAMVSAPQQQPIRISEPDDVNDEETSSSSDDSDDY